MRELEDLNHAAAHGAADFWFDCIAYTGDQQRGT